MNNEKSMVSIRELVLIVLYNGNITGKIKMQNEMFLAYEILKDNMVGKSIFVYSKDIGYYSKFVDNVIFSLFAENKIMKINKGQGHQTYKITIEGINYINLFINDNIILKDKFQKIKIVKQSWDEWNTNGILTYIKRNYRNEW